MKYRLIVFLCTLLSVFAVRAQTSDAPIPLDVLPPLDTVEFPTYDALLNMSVPKADRTSIAERFLGFEPLTLRSNTEAFALGRTDQFQMLDTAQNTSATIDAELVGISDHAYVWVEQPVTVNTKDVDTFLYRFDSMVYDAVRELWGSESKPGIDDDPRLYIVFTRFINPTVDGYFTSANSYPQAIVSTSNEHEMIVFNLNQFENQLLSDHLLSRCAHEFQHMVRHNVDGNESAWVDEGFSVFTEKYLGFNNNFDMAYRFITDPNIQLNNWGSGLPSYGASLMFMSYFYERFGILGMQNLSQQQADGISGVDKTLKTLGHPGVDLFFADWVLANTLQRPDIGYGYVDWWQSLPTAVPVAQISTYPYENTSDVKQYGTHYYVFDNLSSASKLTIDLQKPSEATLLPEVPPKGVHYMYGNVGDESDTTLTRTFDLSTVTSATLRYGVWYNLETYWDYAYVEISTDGGITWRMLPTMRTTSDNPNGRAYGVGYTGESLGWRGDQADLTPYVGQEVQVRFEMITDDAKTKPGIAIDDVAIPEIGYLSDFETGDDGWISEGWIRSDNRLPQRAWVQIIQHVGNEVFITRYIADRSEGHYEINLLPKVDKVTLAVSPFTPVTIVSMPYTLKVSVE